MNGQIKNKINIPEPQKRPDNDNIVAQFLSGIGGVGQGVGQAIGQVGTGLATGLEQGASLIGQGIS